MRRLAPALLLLFLSPLIAEYLLGSMSMAQIGLLPVFVLTYGAGAVLVRELARRGGREWPAILILALAYGVIEEGLSTQSLFNPHFHGLRLLEYGFEPLVGLALPWTIYVLGLHVVWSIAVPVAITELLFSARRTEPWLGKIGLSLMAALFVAGTAIVTLSLHQQEQFMASPVQLGGAGLAALACVALAFALPRGGPQKEGRPPNPWLVAAFALAAGSAFVLLYGKGSTFHWPARLVESGLVAIPATMALFGFVAARRTGWTNWHRFALTVGGLLVYCWYGFSVEQALHGMSAMPAHAGLVAAMLWLILFTAWKVRRTESGAS